MIRFAVVAISVAVVGSAFAAEPLPRMAPGSPYQHVRHADVTAPLSAAMSAAPAMTAEQWDPNCGTCGPTGCRPNRAFFSRLRDWLLYQPGPRCAPAFVPTPYAAPLRSYFHCKSECACLVGGCITVCGDGSSGPRMRGFGLAPRGMLGNRGSECRPGLFQRLVSGMCLAGYSANEWQSLGYTPAAGYQAYGGPTLTPVSYSGTGSPVANRPFTNP